MSACPSGGRDNRGRLLSSGTLLTGQSVNVVTESLSWTNDSRQASYTAARRVDPNTAGNTTTWNDARSYLYTTQRRQLASESWVPGAGQVAKTEVHEQDMGQTGGLGVHTGSQVAAPPGSSGNQVWQVNAGSGQDAFSRVKSETSAYEPIGLTAVGTAKGGKTVELNVNQTTGLLDVTFPDATRFTTGAWNRDLWLPAGGFNLLAKTTHPSGQFTAQASAQFNVGVRNYAVETGYDTDGNVTDRTIAGGYTVSGRTQTMTWDGNGRLIKVVQDEFGGYGYEWTATYDGMNRRVQTLTVPKRNSVLQPGQQVLERSWHDPLVEFLEVGLEVTRGSGGAATKERWWKIHGPDLNGGYGGLEGMGGLEAVVSEATGEAVGLVDDAYGHIIGFAKAASFTAASSGAITFEYHSAQFGGYGALSGTWSPAIAEGVTVWRSFGWRGKRLDITGFYNLGARYYEPVSGRFLSADPWAMARA